MGQESDWALNTNETFGVNRLLYSGEDWGMPEYEGERSAIIVRLITCMYYALTTLATVGYGDFFPCSVAEKIVGSIIQIFGVTFFSILMNNFIEVVLSMRVNNLHEQENQLQCWFALIKKIKN